MADYAIRIQNLSKRYRIGEHVRYRMLRDSIQAAFNNTVHTLRSVTSPGRQSNDDSDRILWALNDVSFDVEAGESIGIIGSNGAGKSTLLKVLAHITAPTSGRVRLRGRVGSLLEVGTGFHPELTGRENIFLNGAILGMRKREIEHKFDEIVDFSEIEKFLDTPVKFYSSGMRMRLAFSVAAHLEPEILLIDEVLAVGDVAFQKKSLSKMSDVVKQGRTVLFVSHNMGAVRSLCNSAVYMEHGRVEFIGDLNEAIEIYLSTGELQQASSLSVEPDPHMNMQVLSITVLDQDGNPSNRLPHDQPFRVRIQAAVRKPLARAMLILNIEDHELDTVISSSDFFEEDAEPVTRQPGVYTYEVRVPSPLLVPGSYRLTLIARQFKSRTLHRLEHVCPFELFDNGSVQARVGGKWRGKVSVPLQWECSEILPPDSMQYLENEA